MKKYFLIIPLFLLILSGCGSKSSFFIDVGDFVLKFYHNDIKYKEISWDVRIEWLNVIKRFEEQIDPEYTWYINSLFAVRTLIESWLNLQEIVDTNKKQLEIKLLKYVQIKNKKDTVKCKGKEYPWYITTFSYLLWKDMIYNGQYYLLDDTLLYIFSFSSNDSKDIKRFVKSVGKIKCIKQNSIKNNLSGNQ